MLSNREQTQRHKKKTSTQNFDVVYLWNGFVAFIWNLLLFTIAQARLRMQYGENALVKTQSSIYAGNSRCWWHKTIFSPTVFFSLISSLFRYVCCCSDSTQCATMSPVCFEIAVFFFNSIFPRFILSAQKCELKNNLGNIKFVYFDAHYLAASSYKKRF